MIAIFQGSHSNQPSITPAPVPPKIAVIGKRMELRPNFVPTKYSVLCGRGKKCTKSTGNRYLKSLIESHLGPYSNARNKIEKSAIVSVIISAVKRVAPEGAFVKYEDDEWWEVDDTFAREKIGCIFRDCLHSQYKSSTKSKLARKKAFIIGSGSHGCGQGSWMTSTSPTSFLSQMTDKSPCSYPSHNIADDHQGHGHPSRKVQSIPSTNFALSMTFENSSMTAAASCMSLTAQPSPNEMQDYCSLLSDYLNQQQQVVGRVPARPQRPDFLTACMLPKSSPVVAVGGGYLPNNTKVILQEACDLIAGDFPDDISDIFEEDDY